MRNIYLFYLLIPLILMSSSSHAQDKINVVTTLTVYADIAGFIGGDQVDVHSIVSGDQDAHYVQPKPSFAVWMNKADLFIETGLDLEMWAPALIDKSRNPEIRSGQVGYVAAADGVPMLEVPDSPDRGQGDVHIYGNPHIFTSPLNAKIIGENIAVGLSKIRPEQAGYFRNNLERFRKEIDQRMYGEQLVNILGGETLEQLNRAGTLLEFLKSQKFQGTKLEDYLGGWMKQMLPLRGLKLIAYHKNWVYFEKTFNLEIIDYIEPKPGIPPSPKHIEQVMKKMKQLNARIILSANYFDVNQINEIASKIDGIAVIVPLGVTEQPETSTYFKLVDYWIDRLTGAYYSMQK